MCYWSGELLKHRQANSLYRRMRIGAAQPELSRSAGKMFLAPGYDRVSRDLWLRRFLVSPLPEGAHFW